jgi:D-alanyl-D-alanine carboxypeptidase (penicillin-binding protein 5/6)
VEEKKEEQTDKELHPERYDESLFKRAYKAGLELKELNEKEKKKKFLIQIVLIIFSLLLISFGIYYLATNKPPEYTSPVVWDIEEILPSKSPVYVYGIEDVNTDISSESSIVFDPDSGEILFKKDIDTRRKIASLTKIMTAIVVMDNMNLTDTVTVENIPTYGEEEIWSMELEQGDVITVENLLKMMLVSSYNDAAIVLAESFGSEEFLSLMNEKASILGLSNTHFSNPCGFDNSDNYSTADDLRKLVSAFLEYPTLTDIVKNLSMRVEYIRDGDTVTKTIYTTNSMLEEEYVKGIKTGYTEDAGECLISLFEYDNGKRLVTILLNSEDRDEDTKEIEEKIRDLIQY